MTIIIYKNIKIKIWIFRTLTKQVFCIKCIKITIHKVANFHITTYLNTCDGHYLEQFHERKLHCFPRLEDKKSLSVSKDNRLT